MLRQASFGGRQLVQRHVILVRQVALAVALPAPSRVFGERGFGLVTFQLGDEREHVAGEFGLGIGQRGVAANQQPGGAVGGQAIEIRINQNRYSLFGFLQQTGFDGVEVLAPNAVFSKNTAA